MENDLNSPITDASVCQALLNHTLISAEQAQDILNKKQALKQKLKKFRGKSQETTAGSARIESPITIIDVIVSLNLQRADDAGKWLDEEVIYQTLAKEWGMPYKKIDPLKLDLNLVTSIIPRSFAMKHLVLPTAIQDGYLTVATCNPFNMEALEDIERASRHKVKTVVSGKADIIKLIDEFFDF